MPTLARTSKPRPLTNSPQTLCRGYSFDSITVTGTPCWRSAIPALSPAIPPPIIVTFFNRSARPTFGSGFAGLCKPLRAEAMAEKAGLGFLHVPAALRPQSGEFFADKSGAHADRCIMSGDIIAADQCEEFGESEWKSGASRFQCNEQICAQRQMSEQQLQAIIIEMVQEQIAQEGCLSDLRLSQPLEGIRSDNLRLPAELAKTIEGLWLNEVNAIEQDDFEG